MLFGKAWHRYKEFLDAMATNVGLQLEAIAPECQCDPSQAIPSCDAFSELEASMASKTTENGRYLPLHELYEAILLSKSKPWPRVQLLKDIIDLLITAAKGVVSEVGLQG